MISTLQNEFTARSGGRSQCELILAHLEAHANEWVAMPALARVGAGSPDGFCMVHSRIADLRKQGHVVEHSQERREGKTHSFYRLVKGPQTIS